jgi:hypothetical protein
MAQPDPKPLDYATPSAPRNANPTLMFYYLMPTSVVLAAFLGSWFIEWAYPGGDSRNFQGPCCMMVFAPGALVCGVLAIIESTRPNGRVILLRAIILCLLAPLAVTLCMWLIVTFGLFRHV